MTYSVQQYALVGIIIPVAIFAVTLICGILASKFMQKHAFSMSAIISPFVIICILMLLSISFFSDGFQYPVIAVFQRNADQYLTTGKIEEISPAPSIPVYYDSANRTFDAASFLTIGGRKYYIPYGDFEIGQTVQLRWGTDENVVYAYTVIYTTNDIESETVLIPKANSVQSVNKYQNVGNKLISVCSILFVFLCLIQYPANKRIAVYLQKKDQEIVDKIIPNRFGMLYTICGSLPLLGIAIGCLLTGFWGAIVCWAIAIVIFTFIFVQKRKTEVYLDGSMLVLKGLFSTQRIALDDIDGVSVEQSPITFKRCFVILLRNSIKIQFEQENYYGISAMYQAIKKAKENARAQTNY